jgi:hypothetical protein
MDTSKAMIPTTTRISIKVKARPVLIPALNSGSHAISAATGMFSISL